MKLSDNKQKKISYLVFGFFVLVYMGICFYLYYNQLDFPVTGKFEADTPFHVSMAVEDHFFYSLTSYIYWLLAKLPWGNGWIALFLSDITASTVILTYLLLKKVASFYEISLREHKFYILSFATNILIAFYVKAVNKQRYIGYTSANMWHNSTYICMRFMAVLTLILFIKIYEEGLSVKNFVWFTVALTVTTAIKPSFLTVFAPVMAIELLWDLCKKKKPFKKVLFFALSVVPSLLVIVLQSLVLFGGETGNGYAISPFTALSQRGDHPKAALVVSIVFPLLVLLYHIKDFWKDRIYFGSILIWLFGFLEVFLFTETGSRSGDQNFMWGYSIALFIWFLESVIVLNKDLCKLEEDRIVRFSTEEKQTGWVNITFIFRDVYLFLTALALLWHVSSGIWYLSLLLKGATYFI